MSQTKLEQWLLKVQKTLPEELSCSECFDLVSTYVELEENGQAADKLLPQLKHHLDQCGVCHQEYELLRSLVLAETGDESPSLVDLLDTLRKQLKS